MPDAALAATQAIPFGLGSLLADRYELRALLGEGGMGAVYRAFDRELDEDVALKVLHLETSRDGAALIRFRREVKLARRVTHRNVARTFDLGLHRTDSGGIRFLTMELIEGVSLAKHAGAGPLHLPEALRIAAEVARGMCAAHVVGVVHRDLKPDNVMLGEERVVITDFGIARVADGSADVMRTGAIVGTPAYMAPEQIENGVIDGRTDVYALGTMLFQLLTSRLPFEGSSAISLAAQRITGEPPDLRSVDRAMPEGVAQLVREMLARRREDRPDAQSVLDRIEALRGNAAMVGASARRALTFTSDASVSVGQPRTVAVEPLVAQSTLTGAQTAEGGGLEALAPLLTSAVVDGLNEARLAQVVLARAGQEISTELVVQGTLHASGGRVRVRLRLLGQRGAPAWSGHVDGTLDASLDLEDRVVEAVTDAIRARTAKDPGPVDPSLREAYDKAKAEISRFALPNLRNAITILEDIESTKPGDPRVRTLLARALLSAWSQTGARDRALPARAEELALRALQDEPSLPGAHQVIAVVRLQAGELVAALRAYEECLRYDPRYAGAHEAIGSLLCESLFIEEGRRRLELATRLDPTNTIVALSRIETAAMLGERDQVRSILAELEARSGPVAAVIPTTRVAVWWDDHEMALRAADVIERTKAGASWDTAAHVLRCVARRKADDGVPVALAAITSSDVAPRHRTMMHEIAADCYSAMGEAERALDHVVRASRLPFTNLLWLDRSPPLALVRSDPRFAEARATTAARCADLFGGIGQWPAA